MCKFNQPPVGEGVWLCTPGGVFDSGMCGSHIFWGVKWGEFYVNKLKIPKVGAFWPLCHVDYQVIFVEKKLFICVSP